MNIPQLINAEGWKIFEEKKNGKASYLVKTPYEDDIGLLKAKHPAFLHLDIYAKHSSPEVRFQHLKKSREVFWPTRIWHDWTRRRYEAHCEYYNYISQAGGGSKGKSYDWAEIAVLRYFSNPLENNVTIASTTLASLKGRVWGYVTAAIQEMEVQPLYKYTSSPTPQILPVVPPELLKNNSKNAIKDMTLHGMFAVTAKVGDNDQAVANWIGKHPKGKLLVILDEGTDMPMSIINTFPNLNSHPEKFQLCIIGNSKSTQDLHGCLSTPKNGWDTVSTDLDEWETTQLNGICQYFNPYKCPAITDPDPEKRKILSTFLIGEENLKSKEQELGTDSENFARMVMGFWKSKGTELTTVSEKFLKEINPRKKVNWSGYFPIQRVAGFDFAISTDGDNPMLRIGNVGHDLDGGVKVDFSFGSSLFKLELKAIVDISVERQIADQIIDILQRYGVPLNNLAVDVTGQGRAIGQCIVDRNEMRGFPLGIGYPMKIYSMGAHNKNKTNKSALDLTPMSTHELWNDIRSYIETDTIRGLDDKTIYQLVNRQIIRKGDKVELENKKDYKRRMSAIGNAHSPDEADATALALQVVRQRLGILPGVKWKTPTSEQAQSHLDRVYAMGLENRVIPVTRAIVAPKVNFTAGLEKYAKFKQS